VRLDLRPTSESDASAILALYRKAAEGPGLARYPDELDAHFAAHILEKAASGGISIGAFEGDRLVGEIHGWRPGPRKFAHVLGDLTVAVDPDWHGKGVGSALFEALFARAAAMEPRIERIELFVHTGNPGAKRLYERLGFVEEGRLPARLRFDDGQVHDDFMMAKRIG